MTLVQSLRSDAEYAFGELMQAVDGLTQEQAWGKLPASSDEYLHTDGSVQGILLHTASSKRMYGSICFRDTELRWQIRDEYLREVAPLFAGTCFSVDYSDWEYDDLLMIFMKVDPGAGKRRIFRDLETIYGRLVASKGRIRT